ncbi:MAG: hypothetical protein K5985_07080 [Lachnospiraceae bacterium]|nr:hypothetical protein [Lachnospiraceae bacterium]
MFYSFDVFDTLITRKTATPGGIFALMQRTLRESEEYAWLDEYLKTSFYSLRVGSEQQARKVYRTESRVEISLEEIYEVMKMTLALDDAGAQRLCALERKTELENIIGVEDNIRRLFALKAQGHRVVLISDMYLDEETLRGMLRKADPNLENLPLYLSSVYGQSKAERGLYRIVEEAEGVSKDEWVHIGDNPYVDDRVPKSMGIQTEPCPMKALLPVELEALKQNPSDAERELRIGTAANLRMFRAVENTVSAGGGPVKPESAAWRYGVSFCGPLILPYMEWVLIQALKKGIKRLYFIARDGYLMKEIADSLIERYKLSVRTEYIYGSRQAWRAPAFSERFWNMEQLFHWSYLDGLTVSGLARIFGLEAEELMQVFPERFSEPSQKVSREEVLEMVPLFQKSTKLCETVSRKNREKRELLLQYLRENIDVSDSNFAFVELIGSGYSQLCLSALLKELADVSVTNFFYHLDADFSTPSCRFYTCLPCDFPWQWVIELFFSAPHGRTIGYRKGDDGRICPVLNEESLEAVEYGLSQIHAGAKEYACACDAPQERWGSGEALALSFFYMKYLSGPVDPDLADFIGDMPYGEAALGGDVAKYAPRLTAEDIKNLYLIRDLEPVSCFYPKRRLELSLNRLRPEEKRLREHYLYLASVGDAAVEAGREAYWTAHGGIDPALSLRGFDPGRLKKRIAVYGAGKYGKRLVRALHIDPEREVVLWVDKNPEKARRLGFEVHPAEELAAADFEQVVIAIANAELVREVREKLSGMGIDESRIVTYFPLPD